MSSAVNKSSKRFMPKVASRGPASKGPGRRLSMLRTSFSVPQNLPNKAQVVSSEAVEQAIEDPKSDNLMEKPMESTDEVVPSKTPQGTPKVTPKVHPKEVHHRSIDEIVALPPSKKQSLPQPRPNNSIPHPPSSAPLPSTANSAPQEPNAAAYIPPQSAPQSDHQLIPPEGCEFVNLESLPQLKMNERRRRIAFEREFVLTMRDLYFEREKQRLSEVSDLSDEYIEIEAQKNANNATYHQLKQTVGQEAKILRNKKLLDFQETKPILNEQKTTMATLCKDLPIGETNAAFDDYELARVNRRRDTTKVFKAKMWSRGLYKPKEEEKPMLQEAFRKYQDERKDRSGRIKVEQTKKFSEIDNEADFQLQSQNHPQATIEIQSNGAIKLVGTQYDRHQNNRAQNQNQGQKTEVDPTEQVINSFSFSTKERPDRWTKEETEKFYEAVSALGTDFNLISHLFPTRSRNQIKTKFKYEEKRNPAKLHIHMVSRRKFSLDSYSKVSNVDIVEVNSIESELEKIRQEHEHQMKLDEKARQEAKAEDRKPIRKPKREKV